MTSHWINKHVLNIEKEKGSLFSNQSEADVLINETILYGREVSSFTGLRYISCLELQFDQIVGITQSGKPCYTVKVVYNKTNDSIVTAYPVQRYRSNIATEIQRDDPPVVTSGQRANIQYQDFVFPEPIEYWD